MNPKIVIVTLVVLLVIIGVGWLIDHLRHSGVDVSKAAKTAEKVLDVADTVTDAAAVIAPSPTTYTLQKIVDAAKIGVSDAEQLSLNGSITADQRKATAEDVLKRALELDGIAYEGDVAKLGDAAMEAAVRALPKISTQTVKTTASATATQQTAAQAGTVAVASDTTGAE
jgi:CHASE3 domain sensor protein